jgi:hypothetical protein
MVLISFFFLAPPPATSQDLAIGLGTWNPAQAAPGAFVDISATLGLGRRMELGVAAIPRVTPLPFKELYFESHLGVSLLGDRLGSTGLPGIYVNAILDLGGALKIVDPGSASPDTAFLWFGRLTPFALGNPYYGRRDRFFSATILLDPRTKNVEFSFSLLKFDFYLLRPIQGR